MNKREKIIGLILLLTIFIMSAFIIIRSTCTDYNKEPYVVYDTTSVTVTEYKVDTVEVVKEVPTIKVVPFKVTDTLTITNTITNNIVDTIHVYPDKEVIFIDAYRKLTLKIDEKFEGKHTFYQSANTAKGGGEYFTSGLVGVYGDNLCCVDWYRFAGKIIPCENQELDVELIWDPPTTEGL